MILAYVFLLLLFVIDCRPKLYLKSNNPNFLMPEETLPVKGLFVILVFFRHFRGYVDIDYNFMNHLFVMIDSRLSQLIVTMFLFYSGYGIFESIKRKENSYIKSFLPHRFLITWINFAICVCFYLILNLAFQEKYTLLENLMAFTGWTSIGNSNWFMFGIFMLYILVSISFIKIFLNKIWNLVIYTLLTVFLCCILYKFKSHLWYNTLLCFPLGMWFNFSKEKLCSLLEKNIIYFSLLFILGILFVFSFFYIPTVSPAFVIKALLFSICVVLLQYKMSLKSSTVYSFLGEHVFSIYILQRISFMAMERIIQKNVYLYFLTTFILTLIIAVLYDYLFNKSKKNICLMLNKR